MTVSVLEKRLTIRASRSLTSILPKQMPGARCPTCAKQGKEVWVIPGKNCHICGTPVG
ncbi:hypothetical protein BO86DRAFT_308599 [Aspergillus japonicus CBS 114.51]|uniref:Uncharacterized protein n=1 Tax=Aspergillus japonicus CBS 114.51 TaxID=1448312 RepID=A0A8T8X682_ASPJA|nr:hypothetical protein BO86DRAFT_308599 [Aspergillus japonicus CBS 114.51]RAH83658.1 hypothetical protein BO86DRAFT_308599 [Aspergillus japonicus CBS 114.51]